MLKLRDEKKRSAALEKQVNRLSEQVEEGKSAKTTATFKYGDLHPPKRLKGFT